MLSNYANPAACIFICVFFPILSAIAVAARFYTRRVLKTAVGVDDWLCVLALICQIICCSILLWGVGAKVFGYHSSNSWWEVNAAQIKALAMIYKVQWAWQMTSFIGFGAMKLSVLFLYHRIFGRRVAWFNISVWIMIGFVSAWAIIFFFSTLLMCGSHVNAIGVNTQVLKEYCINIIVQNLWGSATDVVGDIIILILPLPMVWRLNMPLRSRLMVCGVFMIGSLSLLAGIFRLYINSRFASAEQSQSNASVLGVSATDQLGLQTIHLFWGAIELGIANIAICLPMLRLGSFLCGSRAEKVYSSVRSRLSRSRGEASYNDKSQDRDQERGPTPAMMSRPAQGQFSSNQYSSYQYSSRGEILPTVPPPIGKNSTEILRTTTLQIQEDESEFVDHYRRLMMVPNRHKLGTRGYKEVYEAV